jgi:cyclopropane-fatty-acyl-phospholipid synthase
MLYKFKSKATGDLIMLEPNGRRVLEAIGKDAGAKGIIQASEMQAAVTKLEAAIAREEAEQKTAIDEAKARGEVPPKFDSVSLRQRALPFIDMLRRAEKEQADVVWGV